jgi:sugar-specific transcriptional regulator TrmB
VTVSSVKLQNALKALGLTEYEAKTYLALVQQGTSSAGILCKLADIPTQKFMKYYYV